MSVCALMVLWPIRFSDSRHFISLLFLLLLVVVVDVSSIGPATDRMCGGNVVNAAVVIGNSHWFWIIHFSASCGVCVRVCVWWIARWRPRKLFLSFYKCFLPLCIIRRLQAKFRAALCASMHSAVFAHRHISVCLLCPAVAINFCFNFIC